MVSPCRSVLVTAAGDVDGVARPVRSRQTSLDQAAPGQKTVRDPYLALQVRQANRLAHLSATDALRDATNQFREVLLSGDNVDVWLKGIQHHDNMTDTERFRWDELALYLWDSTQATYLRVAHLGERFTVRRIGYTVRYASGGVRFKEWWGKRRERFHPDFARFVDDNLGKPIEAVGGARPLESDEI